VAAARVVEARAVAGMEMVVTVEGGKVVAGREVAMVAVVKEVAMEEVREAGAIVAAVKEVVATMVVEKVGEMGLA